MSGGIILAERLDAAVDTPPSGKINLFPRASASDALAYKDAAGAVHQLAEAADVTALAAAVSGSYQPLDADLTNLAALTTDPRVLGIPIIADGGGLVLPTGLVSGNIPVPFACVITAWTVLLDQSGSIVFDIWKDTYANYPPTIADTITASAKPTVSSAAKATGSPTGWITAVAAGDILRVNIDSVSTATWATLLLTVRRS